MYAIGPGSGSIRKCGVVAREILAATISVPIARDVRALRGVTR